MKFTWLDSRQTGLVTLISPFGWDTPGGVVERSNGSGEKWREGKQVAGKATDLFGFKLMRSKRESNLGFHSPNGNRTRVLALRGPRPNR